VFAVIHFMKTNRSKIIFTLLAFGVWLPALTSQAALTVTNIAPGCVAEHSLFLKSDGSLWAMGNNSYGQLGDGTFNSTNRPEQIVASGVTAIAAGYWHSLFLKSDGSLWVMGYNYYGQLGDGFTNQTSSLPEQIFPPPQPILTSSVISKTNLQVNATTLFGGTFYLRASTNLVAPLSQWQPLRTNSITARGTNNFSVTLTNAVNSSGQQFYILQSP
jgi:alpha-tubulin suppressor-like RCC1 family protein